MRAWAACGLSQAFSEELKTRKGRNYPKCAIYFLYGGEGGRADAGLNFLYALG